MKAIKNCSHCGHPAPQEVVYRYEYVGDFVEEENDCIYPLTVGVYYIAKCETCSGLLLYSDEKYCDTRFPQYNLQISFRESILLWPNQLNIDPSYIPKNILEIYNEALKIKLLSPSSYAVQIRRALEAICIDQGVSNKNLHSNLKELCQSGRLPPLLGEITNIIKIIGNTQAHCSGPSINSSHVNVIEDFLRVVLEYLYIAPGKLKKFKDETVKFSDWSIKK